MKKIIFVNIPMKPITNDDFCFYEKGNANCKYDGKVKYGMIAALYGRIKSQDDVHVVLNTTILNDKNKNHTEENIEFFKSEFKTVLGIQLEEGKNLSVLESAFTETREQMQEVYRKLLDYIEEEAWIYADTTFGPRLNMPIMFSVLNFAERFFDAEIKLILNVKVEFDHTGGKNIPVEGTQGLYDILPFYNLTNMTNYMKAMDGKQAVKLLDDFFNL